VTAELKGVMNISGRPPVTLYDSGASRSGIVALFGFFRPVNVVATVLNNPFENVAITSLEFEIKLHYGLKIANLEGAYLTTENPAPGEVVNLHVRLRKYDESEKIMTVPVRIPDATAGKKIQIEVAGGDYISPVMPKPENLDDLIANVRRYYPPKSLIVGVNVPGEGVSLRGRIIEHLPASAVSSLQPAVGKGQVLRHKTALRNVTSTPFLVQGKVLIPVTVGGRKNK
jgi:hypothetical protein